MDSLRSAVFLVLLGLAAADTAHQCDYDPEGNVTKVSAVPITGFRTGGADTFRNNFCIGHCSDNAALRASMVIQLKRPPKNLTTLNLSRKTSGEYFEPVLAFDKNCLNKTINGIVEDILNNNNDLDSMKTALDSQLNIPGWAYLIYHNDESPNLIFTFNTFEDLNFCYKIRQIHSINSTLTSFFFVGGLIAP